MAGKIIDFPEYRKKYNQNVTEISSELNSLKDRLFSYAVKLLVTGKWKSWADSLEIGSEINFNEKEMREAGDELIDKLLDLRKEVEKIQKAFQEKI